MSKPVKDLFKKVNYDDLKARQQENFNFQKMAGRLADYGFNCMKLSDDWQGADFLAYHLNGEDSLKVQLKSRVTIQKKYIGKSIHIGFFDGDDCYIFPHDEVTESILANSNIANTESWERGFYSWKNPAPVWVRQLLEPYKI